MLKKGQPKWWHNSKPVVAPLLSHVVDKEGNMLNTVRWPARKRSQKKRYGILEKWESPASRLFGGTGWTQWYRTERDRANALVGLKKDRWAHKKSFEMVER